MIVSPERELQGSMEGGQKQRHRDWESHQTEQDGVGLGKSLMQEWVTI